MKALAAVVRAVVVSIMLACKAPPEGSIEAFLLSVSLFMVPARKMMVVVMRKLRRALAKERRGGENKKK